MEINTKSRNGNLYIFFEGDIDQSEATSLKNKLSSILKTRPLNKVILNMSKITFIDSTFLGILMGRYKEMRAKGVSLYIEEPSRQIDKLLSISGIYTIIPLIS